MKKIALYLGLSMLSTLSLNAQPFSIVNASPHVEESLHTQNTLLPDTLLINQWISETNTKPGFDFEELGANPFDANGDGVSEIITVDLDSNGKPSMMYVKKCLDSTLIVLDLASIRQRLVLLSSEKTFRK